jgi:phosphate transport system substrate-binding protein
MGFAAGEGAGASVPETANHWERSATMNMKRSPVWCLGGCWLIMSVAGLVLAAGFASGTPAAAKTVLRYSCSAQMYEAFEMERMDAFRQETGIEIDHFVCPSYTSVLRLINGASDVASSSQGLFLRHAESGYVETPICRDPLAIVVHASRKVEGLSAAQLRDIFSGRLKTWEGLDGSDDPLIVVVPGSGTAAFKNFERLVMQHEEVAYDIMSYQSTMILEMIQYHKGAISFISYGATLSHPQVQALRVDQAGPRDAGYPYHQTFSFVTKGAPEGDVKRFVEHALSGEGRGLILRKGMLPLPE